MQSDLEAFMESADPQLTDRVLGIADTAQYLHLALEAAGVKEVSPDLLVKIAADIINGMAGHVDITDGLTQLAGLNSATGDTEPVIPVDSDADDYGF